MIKFITKLVSVLRILAFIALGISVIGGTLIFLGIMENNSTDVLVILFNIIGIVLTFLLSVDVSEGLIKYATSKRCQMNMKRVILSAFFYGVPFLISFLIADIRAFFYSCAISSFSGLIFKSAFSTVEVRDVELIEADYNNDK